LDLGDPSVKSIVKKLNEQHAVDVNKSAE